MLTRGPERHLAVSPGAPGSVTVGVDLRGGRFIVSFTDNRAASRQIDMTDPEDDDALGWGLYVIASI